MKILRNVKRMSDEIRGRGIALSTSAPEARELIWSRQDTAEDQSQREHEIGNVTSGLSSGNGSDDLWDTRVSFGCASNWSASKGTYHVGEGRSEDEELHKESPHESTACMDRSGVGCVVVHSDRVVPAEEDECTHEDCVWKFRDDVAQHEYLPRVGLAGAFSSFI